MKKLLHERLRELKGRGCSELASLAGVSCQAYCVSDACHKDIYKAIADEIEKYYIPRPRFEDGEPVQSSDMEEIGGLATCRVYTDGSWHFNPDKYEDERNPKPWDEQTGRQCDCIKRPEPKVLCELSACDFGAPTTRKRWYAVLRRDGLPIRWPEQTHAKEGNLFYKQYVPASACIDFSNTGQSIFERDKPLAEATCRRIARGLKKFVLDDPSPFLVQIGYGERKGQAPRINSIHEPLRTIVAGGCKQALCVPTITRFNQNTIGQRVDEPLATITTGGAGPYGLVSTFLSKFYGGVTGHKPDQPLGTITTAYGAHYGLATAFLTKYYKTGIGQSLIEPLHTITTSPGHFGLVSAFLVKYYGTGVGQSLNDSLGTITTKDRFGLVTVDINGETYAISDIHLRMLTPEELKRAQGFPKDYIIDHYHDGSPVSKSQQVKMIGNSVVPLMAEAIVRANMKKVVE